MLFKYLIRNVNDKMKSYIRSQYQLPLLHWGYIEIMGEFFNSTIDQSHYTQMQFL